MLADKVVRWRLPLAVFAAIMIHGATIGLTDDEAYYWVLAQKPALGYAFHPPAIGLSVALSQALFRWLLGHYSIAMVRLPAAACAAALVALGMGWVERAGEAESGRDGLSSAVARSSSGKRRESGGVMITAFAGLFALAWMIVPDFPMFLGWTLAFVATWEICFSDGEKARSRDLLLLTGGLALAMLSKYSALLAVISVLASILIWAPRSRRFPALAAWAASGVLAALPVLWWNYHHAWGSILYQLRERHGDGQMSAIRYARFWVIELVLMGPALFGYLLLTARRILKNHASRAELYIWVWVLPGALIFCSQPLWADFKPHWALIVWWPLVLGFALAASQGELRRWARVHIGYGMGVISLVWLCCHLPLGSLVLSAFKSGPFDPRLDVTNDLYGWTELRGFVVKTLGPEALKLPFVGSRYQTAAQAAFAMGEGTSGTLLPRDLKALDEWPDLDVTDGQGPEWPRVLKPMIYVADNRYDAGPGYPGARCTPLQPFETRRMGYLAKTIYLWKCEPQALY